VMIFEIFPQNGAIVTEPQFSIVAGVFSAEGDSILLEQSTLYLDGAFLTNFKGNIINGLSILTYKTQELSNGTHNLVINVVTQNGHTTSDSTSFTVTQGDVFFLTPSVDSVLAQPKTIRWRVNIDYTQLQTVTLKQINKYPLTFQPLPSNEYEFLVNLSYGENKFVISVKDIFGAVSESDTLCLVYPKPQKPQPEILFQIDGEKIKVTGHGNDPQGGEVSFSWSTQITNADELAEVDGRTEETFEIAVPSTPGDYALKMVARDEDGYSNSSVNFFTVKQDCSVIIPDIKTVPAWVENARVYSMFIKAYTPAGTIQAAINNLQHIKNMGFNVIWVLPVMDVEGVIDQGSNIGYNIVDFYNVEPAYGTNDDFKDFVQRAHALGLRVILDVTPNHSSRSHPIALDVRSKKKFSRYYDYYQHERIPHNDNGLGQSVSSDGIVYYTGFSDAILNWNWEDASARAYMINVYTHWLREYDIDGFRLDVYWGPHRRYGRENFDKPLRAALRAAKADIMILGETDGTGAGTEVQFADRGGGMDVGYDWILKGAIEHFPAIGFLDDRLYNSGFRPGENSFFLRFLENHDEWRVAQRYRSIEKTIPVSTAIFMATGIPLLFQGQEVGMGFGAPLSQDYRRKTINWQNPPAKILAPHYQKLAQIRAQFPAFRRQMDDVNGDYSINSEDPSMQPRLAATSNDIYAFARPCLDENGVVVMNFSDQQQSIGVILNLNEWGEFSDGFQADKTYFVNNLYDNTVTSMPGGELDTLFCTLGAYDVAVFTISTKQQHVVLPEITVDVSESQDITEPNTFRLYGNYPNPFNPKMIQYELAETIDVNFAVYNVIGQKVKSLINCVQVSGRHQVIWDGLTDAGQLAPNGVYLYQLRAGEFVQARKMLLIK